MANISEQEKGLNLLSEKAGALIQHIDDMSPAELEELYSLLNDAAKLSSKNIGLLHDTEIRVKLCDYRDMVLDKIDSFYVRKTVKTSVYAPYILFDWDFWQDNIILKDVCIAPYVTAKELGADFVLFFGNSEELPSVKFLPGTTLVSGGADEGPDSRRDAYLKFLYDNYKRMDILFLHGARDAVIEFSAYYKYLRPDGRVCMLLDMNSFWKGSIKWNLPEWAEIFSGYNAYANSCRTMRDEMNRDPSVSFDNCWIPNGLYNAYDAPVTADAESKRNVILTVGRIGTGQKNNEELMNAFARIADALPDWSLRLVGPVDERIKPFIAKYFAAYPNLKDRVIFTGNIMDKAELYREYAAAKVFALTSIGEGAPNVYAEALFHGCYFITSDIDAADDITDFGRLGEKYPLGDLSRLATALFNTCIRADKEFMSRHIEKALAYANRYFDWERNAKKIAYMLYH